MVLKFLSSEILIFIDGISLHSETNSSVLQGEAQAVAPGSGLCKIPGLCIL